MFEGRLQNLRTKRTKALGVFAKAKKDLVGVNNAINKEIGLANKTIETRKAEIRKDEALIRDFAKEQEKNLATIGKIETILK